MVSLHGKILSSDYLYLYLRPPAECGYIITLWCRYCLLSEGTVTEFGFCIDEIQIPSVLSLWKEISLF